MIFSLSVGASILMYHSISDNSDDPYSVSVGDFRMQMNWLIENGFTVVSLSHLHQLIIGRDYKKLRKKVVITFDDGVNDFVSNALPIILGCGATATVFLVTGMLGKAPGWRQYGTEERLMTVDEVRHIKSQGITLGSHTSTHNNLTEMTESDLQRQLKKSYEELSSFGETFYSLSYPWGQWSHQVACAAKSAGFECALAVGEQTRIMSDDRFCLPRITMRRDIDLNGFQVLLNRTNLEKAMCRKLRALRESTIVNMDR